MQGLLPVMAFAMLRPASTSQDIEALKLMTAQRVKFAGFFGLQLHTFIVDVKLKLHKGKKMAFILQQLMYIKT
jgi:hypothetical protein